MGFSNNAYAKVWEVKENNGFLEARVSTSYKTKEGDYKQDFGGFVRFMGDAVDKAQFLNGGETIRLLRTDVAQRYDKETDRTYTTFKVFDFDIPAPKGEE